MAKLAVTATVIFFLFALCHAFIPLDLPENEDVSFHLPGSVPDTVNMILLPSEKSDSEPATAVESEPATDEIQPKLEEADVTVTELTIPTESDDSVSIPLKTVSFRPTDRLFRSRPIPLYFRHGHRCRFHRFHHLRHHQHHDHDKSEDQIREFKQWGSKPMVHSTIDREVPYGNDMILSSGNEDSSSDRGMVRQAQAPAKWRRFGHGGPRFHIDDDVDTKMKMKRHHRHVEGEVWDREEHEEREHKHRHEHEHGHEHEHEHEGGFMRKIRKFLNHHF